jgi:hypothetical protein
VRRTNGGCFPGEEDCEGPRGRCGERLVTRAAAAAAAAAAAGAAGGDAFVSGPFGAGLACGGSFGDWSPLPLASPVVAGAGAAFSVGDSLIGGLVSVAAAAGDETFFGFFVAGSAVSSAVVESQALSDGAAAAAAALFAAAAAAVAAAARTLASAVSTKLAPGPASAADCSTCCASFCCAVVVSLSSVAAFSGGDDFAPSASAAGAGAAAGFCSRAFGLAASPEACAAAAALRGDAIAIGGGLPPLPGDAGTIGGGLADGVFLFKDGEAEAAAAAAAVGVGDGDGPFEGEAVVEGGLCPKTQHGRPLFGCFPYDCLEPGLVRRFLGQKWHRKKTRVRTLLGRDDVGLGVLRLRFCRDCGR